MEPSPAQNKAEIESAPMGVEIDSLVGTLFEKRYELISKLGAGATGTVYKAKDQILQREVSVKVIHNHLLSNESATEWFKQESATNKMLKHPNIVAIYSQGAAADGRLYMVMDCLEGQSLSSFHNGKLKLDVFFQIFAQIIDALRYAHESGVIHRDIKPSNIIVTEENDHLRPVLVDFGLAKLIDQSGEQGATKTGMLLGSSAYMSPEQCKGSDKIDARSDIYSLGCVMLESLTGRAAFQGDSALDIMYKHLQESITKLDGIKDLPPELSSLISRCLQKDPEQRYQTVAALAGDFDKCANMRDTLKRRWENKQEGKRKTQTPLLAIVGSLMLALGLIAVIKTKDAERKEIQSETFKSKPRLAPPETASGPLADPDLSRFLEKYRSNGYGPQERLKLLANWEKRFKTANDRDKANAMLKYVEIYSEMDDLKNAEKYRQRVKSYGFTVPESICTAILAKMYRKHGMFDKALDVCEDTVKQKDPSSFPIDQLISLYAEEGITCYFAGDYKNACKKFERTEDVIRSQTDELRHKTVQYNFWRYIYITCMLKAGLQKEIAAVRTECIEAARLFDNTRALEAQVYSNIADSYERASHIDDAIMWYQKALDLAIKCNASNEFTYPAEALQRLLCAKGQYEKCLQICQKSLEASALQPANRIQQLINAAYLSDHLQNSLSMKYIHEALSQCDRFYSDPKQLDSNSCGNLIAALSMLDQIQANATKMKLEAAPHTKPASELLKEWISRAESQGPHSYMLLCLYRYYAVRLRCEEKQQEALKYLDKALSLCKDPLLREKMLIEKVPIDNATIDAYKEKMFNYELLEQEPDACKTGIEAVKFLSHGSYDKVVEFPLLLRLLFDLHTTKQDSLREPYLKQIISNLLTSEEWSAAYADSFELAQYYLACKEYGKAADTLAHCVAGLEKHYGKSDKNLRRFYNELGRAQTRQMQYAEAERNFKKSLAISQASNTHDLIFSDTLCLLQEACMFENKTLDAEKYMKLFLATCIPAQLAQGYYQLSTCYSDPDKRIAIMEKGLKIITNKQTATPTEIADFCIELSSLYLTKHDPVKGAAYAQQALESSKDIKSKRDQRNREALAIRQLARVEIEKHDYPHAAFQYSKACSLMTDDRLSETLEEWLARAREFKSENDVNTLSERLKRLKSGN